MGVCVAAASLAAASRELTQAQARVDDLRRQVEAGVAPKASLDRAEATLADAQDADLLQRTLYGVPDLTEQESTELVSAARRRLERRQAELAEVRRTVEAGGLPRLSLGTPLENLDMARREWDLAESRVRLVRELVEMARAEQALLQQPEDPLASTPLFDRYDGDTTLSAGAIYKLESTFLAKFEKPLPVSARGETAIHRWLGFDHRNRIDVAVHPDEPEGVWLRQFLVNENIPFFSFRHFVPGKATGAHVHIGPQSLRVTRGG